MSFLLMVDDLIEGTGKGTAETGSAMKVHSARLLKASQSRDLRDCLDTTDSLALFLPTRTSNNAP